MALRGQVAVAPNLESRPLARDSTTTNKKQNILQRWTTKARTALMISGGGNVQHGSGGSSGNGSSGNNYNTHHHSTTNTMQSSTPSTSTRSSSASLSSSYHFPTFHHRNLHMVYASPTTSDLLPWLQTECPRDLVPVILAYAGPQVTSALNRTNRFWHNLVKEESTWRSLCEGMYKWNEGENVPSSWKDYYRYNPCVPIDYPTVHSALSVLEEARSELAASQEGASTTTTTTVRILLRPGRYILREPLTVHDTNRTGSSANNNNTDTSLSSQPHVGLELETMVLPEALLPTALEAARRPSFSPAEPDRPKRRKAGLRGLLSGCRTNNAVMDMDDDIPDDFMMMGDGDVNHDMPPQLVQENDMSAAEAMERYRRNNGIPPQPLPPQQQAQQRESSTSAASTSSASMTSSSSSLSNSVHQATLVLRTRRHNEPLVRVRQGSLTIRNMVLKHTSHGTDIWNGNSAIQIQPPMGPDDQPLAAQPLPTAILDRVEITSASGRGIVNIDGGQVTITSCYVHDCAATGIYVGGPGSRATIERTDVVRNGNGNRQHRRGIARGHSGIYLEQGNASIIDCNVSQNSLTGISAVSPENAILTLAQSDLVSNGTFQLEMPAIGTPAHRSSVTVNNNLASVGLARSRSGLIMEE